MSTLRALAQAGLCPDEAADFADTIGKLVTDHGLPAKDAWRPGLYVDDADPAVHARLAELGWFDLPTEGANALAFLGAGGIALGRGLVSLAEVDGLLGGAPLLLGPRLARYAVVGDAAVTRSSTGAPGRVLIGGAQACPYTDSWGVVAVGETTPLDVDAVAEGSHCAWTAAYVGYLAGMAAAALELTLNHARHRMAFGAPLTSLDAVQRRLADAATTVDALTLLACADPSSAGLAHSASACVEVLAECHQVTGAIGFTVEYPLQRYFRRSVASAAWVDSWLEGGPDADS